MLKGIIVNVLQKNSNSIIVRYFNFVCEGIARDERTNTALLFRTNIVIVVVIIILETGRTETCSGGITDHFRKMSFFRSFINPLKGIFTCASCLKWICIHSDTTHRVGVNGPQREYDV